MSSPATGTVLNENKLILLPDHVAKIADKGAYYTNPGPGIIKHHAQLSRT